jgi:peptide/nickel transport system permease protein
MASLEPTPHALKDPRQEADPELGTAVVAPAEEAVSGGRRRQPLWQALARNPSITIGGTLLIIIIAISVIWPFFTIDPRAINPMVRLKVPDPQYWFGTDNLGRDVFIRVVHGGRISLAVGFSVAVVATLAGLLIGLIAGYVRALDEVIMRVMDGLMAIPGILLAIALISLSGASLLTVIVAIGIPEIPRVVRLVRSVVLSVREEPYVEAAIAAGTRLPLILSRHVLPNTIPPLIVQATYVCASAMLLEAILGFLGAGIPPEIPSWGNIMADGRVYFRLTPWVIFAPGIALALTVLAVNLLGDGLRDTLDPKLAKQI